MQSFTVFLALLGLSAAATLTTLNGKDFEEVMTDEVSKDALKPMMDLGAAVADQPEQKDEENLEDSDTEVDSEKGARNTEEAFDHPEDVPSDDGIQFPANMFEKGMTMAFPAMIEGATPYSAGQPNDQKLELRNGNGSARPNGNGSARPNGSGSRSAASASANSFSSGPNSFSGSQAQAFSRTFSNK